MTCSYEDAREEMVCEDNVTTGDGEFDDNES
jgi:hypothetical protein